MDLMGVHNPGVLAVYLGTDQQCYTVRVARSAIAGKQEGILYLLMSTLGLVAPPFSSTSHGQSNWWYCGK